MAEMRWVREIDEARARETNELVDQIKLEIENVKNENKLVKEEIITLKAGRKYREIFLMLLLIICAVAGKYFGSASTTEQQAMIQVQAQTLERLALEIEELKCQMQKESVEFEECAPGYQTSGNHECRSRKIEEINGLMDQIKQEVENLRSENKLANVENNSLKAERGKYRVLGFVFLLMVCALVAIYLGFIHHVDHQAIRLDSVEKRVRNIATNSEMHKWGEFVWSIRGWAAKRRFAKDGSCERIFSEVFYSHKNGYKMCLSLYPNGCDNGKNTHLSVFFRLMRGPFDNILSWPFKHHVTLSIINQHTGIDHVSDTITFDKFPDDIDWKKPKTERNGGIGAPKLIELATLSTNAGLCRDDRIFIRCVVKLSSQGNEILPIL